MVHCIHELRPRVLCAEQTGRIKKPALIVLCAQRTHLQWTEHVGHTRHEQ